MAVSKVKAKQVDANTIGNGLKIDSTTKKLEVSIVQDDNNAVQADSAGIKVIVDASHFRFNQENALLLNLGTGANQAAAGDHSHNGLSIIQPPVSGNVPATYTTGVTLSGSVIGNSIKVFVNGVATKGDIFGAPPTSQSSITNDWVYVTGTNKILFNAFYDSNDVYQIFYEVT